MPKEPTLFIETKGSVLDAYFLLKSTGGNIPPNWIERTRTSRKNLHKEVARILRKKELTGLATLKEWEGKYKKECFYYGIRALLDLDREGKTKL